jgi:trimethylamine:corrinoid methyltransferase-like protein
MPTSDGANAGTGQGLPIAPGTLLSSPEVEGILATAYHAISEIGIEVPDDSLREAVLSETGKQQGSRIVFAREEIDGYLGRWRERNGLGEPGWPEAPSESLPGRERLSLSVMPYSHTYLDPFTDKHMPLTAARLKQAAQLLGTLHGGGVDATVPGHPADVPPDLQPIVQYKLGAQHNPAGGGYGWLGMPATAEYVLKMAEVMGDPITSTVVYVFSPLRLGGQELETAIALRGRLSRVHVGNMGSCGGTLPIFPKAALALAWAETIAGAMCIEALTGLPADWSGGIEPFDFRAQTIPFGAPEQMLYSRLGRDAAAWVRGQRPLGGSASLLTMAKRPGAQAAIEKAVAAALAVAWGCTGLGAAGSLSADEVFSPAQALLDCELRDLLSRVAAGVHHPEDTQDQVLEAIHDDVEAGTFATAETTLRHYRELNWFPRHLRREMLAGWRKLGEPSAVESARREACERIEGATWVLPEPQFSQLEAIYEEARRRLVGDRPAPFDELP